jgi:hypothetical protein
VRRRPLGVSPEALSENLTVAGMRSAATNAATGYEPVMVHAPIQWAI